MIKLEKISPLQLICLILVNRLLSSFSNMPTVTMAPANQDAWIANLLSGILIIMFAIPLLILANRFPNLSFNEYFRVVLGKKIGKFICIIYGIYATFVSMLLVILLSDYLIAIVFPETPIYALALFIIIPCCYASYKGIECISRVSVLFAVCIISVIILYAILNFPNMDFKYFLPILKDTSLKQLSFGAFNSAARFVDCYLFFMFIVNVKKTKKWTINKIFIIAVILFILINGLIIIFTQAVLGPNLAKIMKAPYYSSIQHINLFNIIQRIELFNLIGWIVMLFFKLSSGNIVSAQVFSQAFNTKSYKSFIIPINICIFITVVFTNISNYPINTKLNVDITYLIIFTMNFIIPSIILIVYLMRRKSLEKINFDKALTQK